MNNIKIKYFLIIASLSLINFGETSNAMKSKSKVMFNESFSKFHNTLNHEKFIDREIKLGHVYDKMKYNTLLCLDKFLCSLEVVLSSGNAETVRIILKKLVDWDSTVQDTHKAEYSVLKSDNIEIRRIGPNNIIIRFYRNNDDYLSFVKIYARRVIENGRIFWELIPFEVRNRAKK